MRVRFTRDYRAGPGEQSYVKGEIVDLDQGVAERVIADNYAKEFPRSDTDLAEQAAKYSAGDEFRTPQQIAERVPQVVMLSGDTKTDTEEQRGTADTHTLRKEDVTTTAAVAEDKVADAEKRAKAEARKAAEAAKLADAEVRKTT